MLVRSTVNTNALGGEDDYDLEMIEMKKKYDNLLMIKKIKKTC